MHTGTFRPQRSSFPVQLFYLSYQCVGVAEQVTLTSDFQGLPEHVRNPKTQAKRTRSPL